jgi:hypothetical protein
VDDLLLFPACNAVQYSTSHLGGAARQKDLHSANGAFLYNLHAESAEAGRKTGRIALESQKI